MKDKIKEFVLTVCVSYTIISICAAVINTMVGTQNNNMNTLLMLVFTIISVGVLSMYKWFSNLNPLLIFIIQYVIALALALGVVAILSNFMEATQEGYIEFALSFSVFYVLGAIYFYIETFLETRRMNRILEDIQSKNHKRSV
ncbi:MAG TPA: DUF6608 family protein [Lachnospiraceae bacterium]|nr:DUF6608 family protein [Lachnospiraceae bacterium]